MIFCLTCFNLINENLSGLFIHKSFNVLGSGVVSVGIRRILSEKSWIELDLSAGSGPLITFKGFRNLTSRIFGTFVPYLQFTNEGIRPGMELSK